MSNAVWALNGKSIGIMIRNMEKSCWFSFGIANFRFEMHTSSLLCGCQACSLFTNRLENAPKQISVIKRFDWRINDWNESFFSVCVSEWVSIWYSLLVLNCAPPSVSSERIFDSIKRMRKSESGMSAKHIHKNQLNIVCRQHTRSTSEAYIHITNAINCILFIENSRFKNGIDHWESHMWTNLTHSLAHIHTHANGTNDWIATKHFSNGKCASEQENDRKSFRTDFSEYIYIYAVVIISFFLLCLALVWYTSIVVHKISALIAWNVQCVSPRSLQYCSFRLPFRLLSIWGCANVHVCVFVFVWAFPQFCLHFIWSRLLSSKRQPK